MASIAGTHTFDSSSNPYLNTQRANDVPNIADGDSANKLAITTTNVSIYSNNMRIGFVQSFTPSEQREITPVQELGTEGVVQMVPGNTRGGQIQITRFALYNSDMWNALGLTNTGQFVRQNNTDVLEQSSSIRAGLTNIRSQSDKYQTYGNPFRTLKDQRVPLELRAHTVLPSNAANNTTSRAMLIEVYYDCWVSQYSKQINAGNIIVSENVTLEYSDMYSMVDTSVTKDIAYTDANSAANSGLFTANSNSNTVNYDIP